MEIPGVIDEAELLADDRSSRCFHLALLIPVSGTLGMLGASALQAARLAAHEINASGGINGRELVLVLVDAGSLTQRLVSTTRWMAVGGMVEGFVGFHTSDIHRALEVAIDSRVPYVFTPPHEGGHRRAGVVLSGESPAIQTSAPIALLSRQRPTMRWSLLGNDYVWPRAVHREAAPIVRSAGGEVVYDRLVPLGLDEQGAAALVDELVAHRSDAVLLSLVGRDLVMFNRALSASGRADRMLRLSTALEENGLLAAGGDSTGLMFATMHSFERAPDGRTTSVRTAIETTFGETAPMLDGYSMGCYDGLHLIAALARLGAFTVANCVAAASHLLAGDADAAVWRQAPAGPARPSVQLAQANGLALEVVREFAV